MTNYPKHFREEHSDKTEKWWRVTDYIAEHPGENLTAREIANNVNTDDVDDLTKRHVRGVMDDLEEAGWAQTEKPAKIVTWNHTDSFGHPADYNVAEGANRLVSDILRLFREYGKTTSRVLMLIPALLIGALILDISVWLVTMADGSEPFFSTISVVRRSVLYATSAAYLFAINIIVVKVSPKITLPECVPDIGRLRDMMIR